MMYLLRHSQTYMESFPVISPPQEGIRKPGLKVPAEKLERAFSCASKPGLPS
jgi:hypothetical protein